MIHEHSVVYNSEGEKQMNLIQLFVIAIGLSMDAFAVAICKGLSMKNKNTKKAIIIGLYFGGFQAGMPLLGYLIGCQFQQKITFIDHWIAFVLLSMIGINMLKESRSETEKLDDTVAFKEMLVLAIATSIDALAVGVTFAFLRVEIIAAVTFIGAITFLLSFIGVCIGNVVGIKFKSKAEALGGIILIVMGIKILLEHTGILNL
jgi:manganese efflux pump family protein